MMAMFARKEASRPRVNDLFTIEVSSPAHRQGLFLAFLNSVLCAFVSQAESHNRVSLDPAHLFDFRDQTRFKLIRIGNHFTRGNLFIACAMVAELADTKPAFRPRADRRTK